MTLAHVSLIPYVLAHHTTSLLTDTLVMPCISFPLCPLPQKQTLQLTSFPSTKTQYLRLKSLAVLSLLSPVFMLRHERKDQANSTQARSKIFREHSCTQYGSVGIKER